MGTFSLAEFGERHEGEARLLESPPRVGFTPCGYTYTMALSIKDAETERLATEIAALTGESKTRAIRQALSERKQRLLLAQSGRGRGDRMVELLERQLWPRLPAGARGSVLSKEQEEAILGFGSGVPMELHIERQGGGRESSDS